MEARAAATKFKRGALSSMMRSKDAKEAALEIKRLEEARALVRALQPKEHEICGMKICVMIRVQRLFNVSLANESFTAMLHVVTCWLAVNDAANDAMDSEFEHEQAGKFVYDADPDLAFYEPDFRPRIRVRNLSEGEAALDGSSTENYFFRSWVPPESESTHGHTIVTWEVDRLFTIGTLFDLKFFPVEVEALDVILELKTPVTETKFIPFPNEATFSDCPAGEVAQVAIKSIRLPDYDFIPGHEFSASLYRTTDEDSWTGEIFSGIKCTCWFQRIYTNDFYNIVIAQFCLTSLVLGVWTLDPVDHGNRIANDFVLVLAAVGMKFVVSQRLPPVSYVTLLEKYLNMTGVFLGLATLWHCLGRIVDHKLGSERGNQLDELVCYVWAGCWALFNVASLSQAWHIAKREVMLVKHLGLTRGPGAGGNEFENTIVDGNATDVRMLLEKQEEFEKQQERAAGGGGKHHANPLDPGEATE